jgi:hypothetical protein
MAKRRINKEKPSKLLDVRQAVKEKFLKT